MGKSVRSNEKPDIKTNPSGKHRVLISLKDSTNKRYWSSHLNYPFNIVLKRILSIKKEELR